MNALHYPDRDEITIAEKDLQQGNYASTIALIEKRAHVVMEDIASALTKANH